MFQWLVLHSRGENCLRDENVLSDEKFAMMLLDGKVDGGNQFYGSEMLKSRDLVKNSQWR